MIRARIAPFLLVGLTLVFFGSPAGAQSAGAYCPTSGVDQLLRSCQKTYPEMVLPVPQVGCETHADAIASLDIAGKTYTWDDYADWGKQLFDKGYVDGPPAGPFNFENSSRSLRISDHPDYTCARCHNDQREDPILTDQDPEARFRMIQSSKPDDYRTSPLAMAQGVTMWGGVNRMRFYNGLFAFFDKICVPMATTLYRTPDDPEGRNYEPVDCGGSRFAPCAEGCRELDTASFADAIQTCGRYCGVGRFLEDWEIQSLLTHFWGGQVHLEDVIDSLKNHRAALESEKTTRTQDIAVVEWKLDRLEPLLKSLDTTPTAAACQALSDSYLLSSCDSLRDASPGTEPDNSTCSNDWVAPADPDPNTPAEDLAVMIRHIRGLGPTLKNPPPDDEPALPFVQDDDVLQHEEHTDEALLRGKALYELSCGRCHGNSPNGKPQVGGRGHGFLAGSRYVFFKMIEDGLNPANPTPPRPDDPTQESLYMPEFTLQRLSYQQAEDIYQYLVYLNGTTE